MSETTLTRKDCKRDNKGVRCANVPFTGFQHPVAKRGSWISFRMFAGTEHMATARVIGRVVCEGVEYIEAAALFCTGAGLRWILPQDVQACYEAPPVEVLQWIIGEWSDPSAIFRKLEAGIFPDVIYGHVKARLEKQ